MRKLLISGLMAAMAARAVPIQLQSSTLQIAASSTIVTLQLNTVPTIAVGNYAVVGGEFTLIRAYNGAQLTVSRAQAGTIGASHAIGTVTWIAPSGATISADPVGACTRSTMPYAPVLSYASGTAWDCIGSVWTAVTPGFYDSGLPGYRNIRGTAAARASTACDIGDKYFTTDSVAGQNLYGCTATNTWTLLSGGGGSGAFSALTGGTNTTAAMVVGSGASIGVTGSGANTATALTAGATAAGRVIATAIAAPATPSAGTGAVYVDSTSKNIAVKDDAGTVKHGVQDAACGSSFVSAISAAGVSTCSAAALSLGNAVTRVDGQNITVSASDADGFAVGTGPTSTTTLATFTIDTRVITGIADLGGSPKQTRLTFASAWATTVMSIADVMAICNAAGSGTAGLNNLFTIQDRPDTTHADIILDSTGMTYTASSATAGCNAAATGYVYFAGDDAATVQVQVPSASGLILTSTGGPTTINQALSPTYGGVPFGAVAITAGAFSGTAINARTAMRTSPVYAGNSGISVVQGSSGTTVSTTADVMSKSGTNTVTGSITADNASSIRPIKQVSADPGTCTTGEAFLNTTSHVAKDCTQTNTLTARAGSGSSYDPLTTTTQYIVDDFSENASSTSPIPTAGWNTNDDTCTRAKGAAEASHWGLIALSLPATNSKYCISRLTGNDISSAGVNFLNSISTSTGVEMKLIVKSPANITAMRFSFGLANLGTFASEDIEIIYDTAQGDTAWMCENQTGGVASRITTGVTVATSTWYTLDLKWDVAGTTTCTVNAASPVTRTADFPPGALSPYFGIQNKDATARVALLDFFAMKYTQ